MHHFLYQHCLLFWVAFLLWEFFPQLIHETVLTAAKDFFCWNDGASIWIFVLDKLEALLAELWKSVLSHYRHLKIPLLLWLWKLVRWWLEGFFLVLGSSLYSIGKRISRKVTSCLGQESGIFLCEWHAQKQTWHHSCWCASDWANAIIIISILCSISFLMLPNSLFAFYFPITAVHCLHSLSSVLFQISASLAVCECVSSCVYPDSGLVLTTRLINSSHCQDLQEIHVWFYAVSAVAVYAGSKLGKLNLNGKLKSQTSI